MARVKCERQQSDTPRGQSLQPGYTWQSSYRHDRDSVCWEMDPTIGTAFFGTACLEAAQFVQCLGRYLSFLGYSGGLRKKTVDRQIRPQCLVRSEERRGGKECR